MALDRRSMMKMGLAGTMAPLAPAMGQAPVAPPSTAYSIPFTEVLPLTSHVNGIDYLLYVRRPVMMGDKPLPTIWLLDADYSFAVASSHVEHLADRNHIPDQLIVAIAYAGSYPHRNLYQMHRSRDYTPIFSATGGYGAAAQKASGGGPDFLKMIEQEAIPLIASRFSVDPVRRTLVGHSFGGLFASWVLQKRPDLFDRFLIVSPSLWYADEWLLKQEAEGHFQSQGRETRAWMGVGAWEEQASSHRMVSLMQKFAKQLRARADPDLHVEARIFADETHASIFPTAFSTGIRHLYPTDWLAQATPEQMGLTCGAT